MKKKLYLKPDIKIAGFVTHRFIASSPGWSKDGNPPYTVEQEGEVDDNDRLPSSGDVWDGGYGGFLDLD